jgi:hypothetical protein
MYIADGSNACGHCGKVYNPYIGDRFRAGRFPCTAPAECETGEDMHDVLCEDCHRSLIRD